MDRIQNNFSLFPKCSNINNNNSLTQADSLDIAKCCIEKCGNKPNHLKINCEVNKKIFLDGLILNYQRYFTKEQYDIILKQMEEGKDLSEILSLNNISENVFKKIVKDQSYLHAGYSNKKYNKIN